MSRYEMTKEELDACLECGGGAWTKAEVDAVLEKSGCPLVEGAIFGSKTLPEGLWVPGVKEGFEYPLPEVYGGNKEAMIEDLQLLLEQLRRLTALQIKIVQSIELLTTALALF